MSVPGWAVPDEPKPAPGPLLLVQSLVNTLDRGAGTDVLAGGRAAASWLRQAGLLGAADRAGPADLRMARQVRESIRALLAANGGAAGPADGQLAPLRELAARAAIGLEISPAGQVGLQPRAPGALAAGLAGLLVTIRDAQRDGTWTRLRACANDDCQWAFYDRSHSRRGAWCDMAACGNRIKNRNLRARRALPPGPPPAAGNTTALARRS
ncbi:MAG TPA: CGNR zinc finger domain-containing protein [Streptosporangiaceae bacterium]|jgi:predicted RNA-binding Zn ribbon-like protein